MKVKDKEKFNNSLKGWQILSSISSMVFHTVCTGAPIGPSCPRRERTATKATAQSRFKPHFCGLWGVVGCGAVVNAGFCVNVVVVNMRCCMNEANLQVRYCLSVAVVYVRCCRIVTTFTTTHFTT